MTKDIGRDCVLVVDDNADFRDLIAIIGKLYGVPVLEACDCRQALDVLTQEHSRIKLILLDYLMPGMEPSICSKSIIAQAGSIVPVVLVTAAANPSLRAAELQIRQWISKPVDPSVLTRLMTEGS